MNDPLLGQTLSGHVLERPIGRGAMGAVYAARGPLGEVVIKVLAPEVSGDEKVRARLAREGEALMRLRGHPHVVTVHSVAADDPRPHLVMELVSGLPLSRLVRERGGRLPPLEAAQVARDVASGLAAVHRLGLIHRDVKPANVLVSPGGAAGLVAKLVDFGVAKDVFRSGLTNTGQVVGTSLYMAPEQWGEHEVDARCDLFALGATLHHALVGRPPFESDDLGELMDLIQAGEVEPLRAHVPDAPRELELVLLQLLVPDLRFRYQRAEQVKEDLERVLRGEPAQVPAFVAPQRAPRGEPTSSVEAGRQPGSARVPLLPGRRFTLGREAACEVPLDDPTVSRQHAQLRREAGGWILRDLRSSYGTFVQGERLTGPRALRSGDVVRVGDVTLSFVDPNDRAESTAAAFQDDLARLVLPEPALALLARVGDARAAAWLIERAAPDPALDAMTATALGALLGEEVARAALGHPLVAAERRAAAATLALLARTPALLRADDDGGLDVEAALGWWDRARPTAPPQAGPAPDPGRTPLLSVVRGEATGHDLALDGRGLVLAGRDERCELRLGNLGVSRLHATFERLHRRWIVKDAGSRAGTRKQGARVALAFMDPGDEVALGDVGVRLDLLEDEPGALPRAGLGYHVVDPALFAALEAMRHPAVASGLVALLHEPSNPAWTAVAAAALASDEATRAQIRERLVEAVRARAAQARAALPALLGVDAGPDPRAWSQALVGRRGQLPPQLLPRGWVSLTRHSATRLT